MSLYSSQVTEWPGESAGALAAVVLIITDSSPPPPYTVGPCTSPDITIDTFCFTAGGTTTLTKYWTRTGAHTLWYGWPEEVSRNIMNSPDWTMLTETKWEWLDVANCTHIFQIQCNITIRIKHKIVIIHYSFASYIKRARSSNNYL